jgi:hypothetical protein
MERTTCILAVTALACLALLTTPALAAPPLHRVTFHGSGESIEISNWDFETVGAAVTFAAQAQQKPDGTWTGRATFTDETNRIVAHMVVDEAHYDWTYGMDGINLMGDAAVYIDGEYDGTYPFMTVAHDDVLGDMGFQMYWLHIFRDTGWLGWDLEGTYGENIFASNWLRIT